MDFDELVLNGKVKRIFRAKCKITTPNIVSHITQRAAGKEPLFLEDMDYLFMLSQLKEITKKRGLDIYAFCLLPNHAHLLASPREDDLHDSMRDLFSRYAMRFNKKYMRKGHLFGGRYRQAVCLDDVYLLTASLYIHMNPVRAGLVNDPQNFRWSSVRVFCDPQTPKSFLKPGFILGLLSNDFQESREVYLKMLMRAVSLNIGDALEQECAVARFRKAIRSIFPSIFSKVARGRNIFEHTGTILLDEGELERQIAEAGFPNSTVARRFLVQQLIARGYKRWEIAEKLGVSTKTVYNILHSGQAKRDPESSFAPTIR